MAPRKMYYTNSRIRYLVSTLFCAALELVLLSTLLGRLSERDWSRAASISLAVLIVLLGGLFCYASSRSHIITAPDGLELHTVGHTIRTAWVNIERIDAVSLALLALDPGWMGKSSIRRTSAERMPQFIEETKRKFPKDTEGLILREPALVERRWWARGMVLQTRFVSLSDFSGWRYNELGQDFKRYAPYLFEHQALK